MLCLRQGLANPRPLQKLMFEMGKISAFSCLQVSLCFSFRPSHSAQRVRKSSDLGGFAKHHFPVPTKGAASASR